MRDLNFFSSYNKKRSKIPNKYVIFYSLIGTFIMGIIIFGLRNFILIRKLSVEVSSLKEQYYLLSKDEKIKDISDREQNIRLAKDRLETLNALDDYVSVRDIINESLLENIRASIPKNLFFDSILINSGSIRIEGKSKDKDSISQFQYNLSQYDDFSQVFIPEVVVEDGYYSFYLSIFMEEEKIVGKEIQVQ
ncbi:MAG TPA: PilN domain-containing protein [Defluviitaleaceae bacterium]|uniref:PilN domain-containing protein n=1 Tax=Lutispora sp. TaxID=2828727 RepID=UPI002C76856D|nr:PilN domain-containing protein [Defluviitaleaceae bacterium]